MYSSFDFGSYSTLSVKNKSGGEFLLKRDKSFFLIVPKTGAWVQHLILILLIIHILLPTPLLWKLPTQENQIL